MEATVAIVFDFDDTLAPDSTSAFLKSLGVDIDSFWKQEVAELLKDGWDPIPAYLYKIIELSKKQSPITGKALEDFGKKITFYSGVDTIFDRLKNYAHSISSEVKVEFYLISSGIGRMLCNCSIAKYFTQIWASDFFYNENDQIEFPKKIVSFTDKTRYIFHISKRLIGERYKGMPFEVNRKEPPDNRIPLENMIFVGDGYTDVPCFTLIRKAGGTPIVVCEDQDKWGRAWSFLREQRVQYCAIADYSENSMLSSSLKRSLKHIIEKILLEKQEPSKKQFLS